MDKLERLLDLISTLLETRLPLSAEEIRRRVPGYPESKVSFRRAFERDKEDLREMGVPLLIQSIPGVDPPAEGYRIEPDDYYLRDPGFEADELAALHLAATVVQLDGFEAMPGLWKLGGAVASDRATISPGAPLASLPTDPNLLALYRACTARCTVGFSYRGRDRRVDPYRIGYQRGSWYLSGWDHDRSDKRIFRLDRISGTPTIGPPEGFEQRSSDVSGMPDEPWHLGDGEEITARLLVDADHSGFAARQLGESATSVPGPDGSTVFTVAVTNWPAFRTFTLTFLDHAEILGPPDLRDQMITWLTDLAR